MKINSFHWSVLNNAQILIVDALKTFEQNTFVFINQYIFDIFGFNI